MALAMALAVVASGRQRYRSLWRRPPALPCTLAAVASAVARSGDGSGGGCQRSPALPLTLVAAASTAVHSGGGHQPAW
eukprot:1991437-Prymnesium_polylepis.1